MAFGERYFPVNGSPPAARPARRATHASHAYLLGLFFVIYTLNYLDRQIVNILAEPIKRDLHLSDMQLGMMSGLAFALFYTVMGLPLARWADGPRNDRITLITASMTVWSAMTMMCGSAAGFGQLMLARIGVGIGEAGCSPAAHSMISDVVPTERRASALGIYSLGIPIGQLAGMASGGWIAHLYGWRAAFLIVGAPGLVVALIARLTISDPRRGGTVAADAATLRETWRVLRGARVFWLATIGCGVTSMVALGSSAFLGSFLIRVHHVALGRAGIWLGLAIGLGGAAGAWLGGIVCDRLARHDARFHLLLPGIAAIVGGMLMIGVVMVSEVWLALTLLAGSAAMTSFWFGPIFAVVQGVTPPSGRATAAAVHLFLINAIGFGLGPLIVGALSDALAGGAIGGRALGPAEGLRWAIALVPAATLASAAFLVAAARGVPSGVLRESGR